MNLNTATVMLDNIIIEFTDSCCFVLIDIKFNQGKHRIGYSVFLN